METSRSQQAPVACPSQHSLTLARESGGNYSYRIHQHKTKGSGLVPHLHEGGILSSQGNAEMVKKKKKRKSRLYTTCLWETVNVPFKRLHYQSQMRCLLFLTTWSYLFTFKQFRHPQLSLPQGHSGSLFHMAGNWR